MLYIYFTVILHTYFSNETNMQQRSNPESFAYALKIPYQPCINPMIQKLLYFHDRLVPQHHRGKTPLLCLGLNHTNTITKTMNGVVLTIEQDRNSKLAAPPYIYLIKC